MPRPSEHPEFTKSYAIDQIEDIEELRAVAHRMWEAFHAAHSQAAHAIAALVYDECRHCVNAMTEGGDACETWWEWQRKVTEGFGSV